jgi:hypothetical protein
MPLFLGFHSWLDGFRVEDANRWVAVGDVQVRDGILEVPISPEAGDDGHVVGIRLSPMGQPAGATDAPTTEDAELRERLRVLGYVE